MYSFSISPYIFGISSEFNWIYKGFHSIFAISSGSGTLSPYYPKFVGLHFFPDLFNKFQIFIDFFLIYLQFNIILLRLRPFERIISCILFKLLGFSIIFNNILCVTYCILIGISSVAIQIEFYLGFHPVLFRLHFNWDFIRCYSYGIFSCCENTALTTSKISPLVNHKTVIFWCYITYQFSTSFSIFSDLQSIL